MPAPSPMAGEGRRAARRGTTQLLEDATVEENMEMTGFGKGLAEQMMVLIFS